MTESKLEGNSFSSWVESVTEFSSNIPYTAEDLESRGKMLRNNFERLRDNPEIQNLVAGNEEVFHLFEQIDVQVAFTRYMLKRIAVEGFDPKSFPEGIQPHD